MKELSNSFWIKTKGILFLVLGVLSATLLIIKVRDKTVVILFALSVWSFCRFYYFAFYVIERYVDSSYRYSGLLSLASYLIRRRKTPNT